MNLIKYVFSVAVFTATYAQANNLTECNRCSAADTRYTAIALALATNDFDVYVADFQNNRYYRYDVFELETGPGIQSVNEADDQPVTQKEVDTSSPVTINGTSWVAAPIQMSQSMRNLLRDVKRNVWDKVQITINQPFNRLTDSGDFYSLRDLDNAFGLTNDGSRVYDLASWAILNNPITSMASETLSQVSFSFKYFSMSFTWKIKITFPDGSYANLRVDENGEAYVQNARDAGNNRIPLDENVRGRTFRYQHYRDLQSFMQWAFENNIPITGGGNSGTSGHWIFVCDQSGKCTLTYYP